MKPLRPTENPSHQGWPSSVLNERYFWLVLVPFFVAMLTVLAVWGVQW